VYANDHREGQETRATACDIPLFNASGSLANNRGNPWFPSMDELVCDLATWTGPTLLWFADEGNGMFLRCPLLTLHGI
jgi:hypothetical protein